MAEFDTGQAAAGAPRTGQAPVPLIRRADAWRIIPGVEQHEIQQQYPSVSTTWMPWTDSTRHKVIDVVFQGSDPFWKQLLHVGIGGLSSGVIWDDSGQRLSWYRLLAAVGPGVKSIQDRYSGNGSGRGAKELGAANSQIASSEQQTITSPPDANTAWAHLPSDWPCFQT